MDDPGEDPVPRPRDVSSPASARLGVGEARARVRAWVLRSAGKRLFLSVVGGVLSCLGVVALVGWASSEAAARLERERGLANELFDAKRTEECFGGARRGQRLPPGCEEHAQRVVQLWRGEPRGRIERAGAAVVSAVSVVGRDLGPDRALSPLEQHSVDRLVRTFAETRGAAGLPPLADPATFSPRAQRDAIEFPDVDDAYDARVQLENIEPRVLFDADQGAAFHAQALQRPGLVDLVLRNLLDVRRACMNDLLAGVHSPGSFVGSMTAAVACREKMDALSPSIGAALADRSIEDDTAAVALWRASNGADFARSWGSWLELRHPDDEDDGEVFRMLRRGAWRAPADERAAAWARSVDSSSQLLRAFVFAGGEDAPGREACGSALDTVLRLGRGEGQELPTWLRGLPPLPDVGCAMPGDLRARVMSGPKPVIPGALLVGLYGSQLQKLERAPGEDDGPWVWLRLEATEHDAKMTTGFGTRSLGNATQDLDARTREALLAILRGET